MNRSVFIGLFCLFCVKGLLAQQPKKLSAIHLDKKVYMSGDTVWFQVFFPDHIDFEKSPAKIQCISPAQTLLSEFYLPISQASSTGYLPLPYHLQSACYELRVLLYNQALETDYLVLTHPLLVLAPQKDKNILRMNYVEDSSHTNTHTLSLARDTLRTREKIELMISVDEAAGSISSLSISAAEVLPTEGLRSYSVHDWNQSNFQPDSQLVFTGKTMKSGLLLTNRYLALFDPSKGTASALRSDTEGRFWVRMQPFEGVKRLQIWDLFDPSAEIEFQKPSASSLRKNPSKMLVLAPYDSWRLLHGQAQHIQRLFEVSKDSLKSSSQDRQDPWRQIPDYVVSPQEYGPFGSLEEFLNNVNTPLKVRRRKQGVFAKLENPLQKPFFKEAPVFLIDQVLVPFEEFVSCELSGIKSLEIYNLPGSLASFGPLASYGVVSIRTFSGKAISGRRTTFQGLQTPINYPRKVSGNLESHLPYITGQVYWEPKIQMKGERKITRSFYHSDEIGEFEIQVLLKGVDGKISFGSVRYVVVP